MLLLRAQSIKAKFCYATSWQRHVRGLRLFYCTRSYFPAIIRPETQSKSVLKTKNNPLLNDLLFVLLLMSECPLRKYLILCHTLYVTVFIVVVC